MFKKVLFFYLFSGAIGDSKNWEDQNMKSESPDPDFLKFKNSSEGKIICIKCNL